MNGWAILAETKKGRNRLFSLPDFGSDQKVVFLVTAVLAVAKKWTFCPLPIWAGPEKSTFCPPFFWQALKSRFWGGFERDRAETIVFEAVAVFAYTESGIYPSDS
jgi:hypothetical protein